MKTQKLQNQIIVVKAFLSMIQTGDATPKTYHIPGEEGREGHDVTIYKVKPIIRINTHKGRHTR